MTLPDPASMSDFDRAPEGMASAANATLSWRVHPLVERKWASAAACGVLFAAGAGIYHWEGQVLYAGAGVALLFLALNRFFLPSHFEFSAEGITAKFPFSTQSCRWDQIERWVADRRAVWVKLKDHPKLREMQLLLGRSSEQVLNSLQGHVIGQVK